MGPEALVSLPALRHNLQRVRQQAPQSRIFAVVKADAYGHGVQRLLPALGQADGLAVARVEEALQLREMGCRKRLLVLAGFYDLQELQAAAGQEIDLVIHCPEQLRILRSNPLRRALSLWIKVDTGMHRLGLEPQAAIDALEQVRSLPTPPAAIGLLTHLSCADDRNDPTTTRQLACFAEVARCHQGGVSVANSAAILGWPDSIDGWVRPGLMLYGASPFLDSLAEEEGLRPVMTLRSRLIAVRRLTAGDAIGYGASWRCPQAMTVGVVAAGYGDGYPRHAPSGTPVLINGTEVPLVGRVSMDSICVDLRKIPGARVGDLAILWGEGLAAERIARAAGTIPYTLFCGVTRRVAFRVID